MFDSVRLVDSNVIERIRHDESIAALPRRRRWCALRSLRSARARSRPARFQAGVAVGPTAVTQGVPLR
jgi:hypothetical protein